MQNKIVIGLDVGGTTIDGALISTDGKIIGEVRSMGSVSGQKFEDAINNLVDFISKIRDTSTFEVVCCGIGMPNPFDYEQGISYMKHKFTHLYGKNLKRPLENLLGVPVYFVNDADAFALGAFMKQAAPTDKLLGITIGTGLGAGFIDNGRILNSGKSIPPRGEIWDIPFRNGILEDFISARGIEAIYRNGTGRSLSPKAIQELAVQGDADAVNAYHQMGRILGEGLAIACKEFVPDIVVVGGKLARAAELFLDEASQFFRDNAQYQTRFAKAETELPALYGSASYALAKVS